jgi:capsid protein
MFGRYIAADSSNQRRDPGTRIQSSDALLDSTKRKRVIEGARDLWRNYSVAAWAVRKHLDFVSTFTFQASTEDPEFNERLESLMGWYSRPINCDVANRHSLRRMIRLAETRRVLDGDVFLVKVGGKLQAIEGDRIQDPQTRSTEQTWVHGVRLAPGGRMMGIQIYKREMDGRYTPERQVSAGNVMQLAYFDAFDQYRGVSPLVTAIPEFQDCLEVKDYARAKAKITQLFALAITREMADSDDDEEVGSSYQIDLGKGPVKVELDPGDKMDFLESKHPSTEFQSFLTLCLQAALKSLDLPWSFYDESFTNFFGSRSALIMYLQSVKAKREDLREVLDRITVWKILQWIAEGVLILPAGYTIDQLKWDWIPAGMPWWNPRDEVAGDVLAIANKLRTRSEIRRERYGDDWRDVVRKLAEEEQFMREQGIDPATTEQPTAVPVSAAESETYDETEDSQDEREPENEQPVQD